MPIVCGTDFSLSSARAVRVADTHCRVRKLRAWAGAAAATALGPVKTGDYLAFAIRLSHLESQTPRSFI